MSEYRLLKEFKGLFDSVRYLHRNSSLGDFVAMHLYEDLVTLNKSASYTLSVTSMSKVLNVQNKRKGIEARRGDGTFGELITGETVVIDPGYKVGRGPIATVEIGVEVKILLKAMIKQIDRVKSDLSHQVEQFKHKSGGNNPLCIAVIGINHAPFYTSYEKEVSWPTDGKKYKHPIQEAAQAYARLAAVRHLYDEFIVLKYRATNQPPYPFEWVNLRESSQEYGAALIRISNQYQRRF